MAFPHRLIGHTATVPNLIKRDKTRYEVESLELAITYNAAYHWHLSAIYQLKAFIQIRLYLFNIQRDQ